MLGDSEIRRRRALLGEEVFSKPSAEALSQSMHDTLRLTKMEVQLERQKRVQSKAARQQNPMQGKGG